MDKIEFKIRIHSVIDIITNSSTEMFVSATKATEEAVTSLFESILKINNIEYSNIDDVIIIKRDYYQCSDSYDDIMKYDDESYSTQEEKDGLMEALSDDYPCYWIKVIVKPEYEQYFSKDLIMSIENIISSISTVECMC